MLIRDIDFNQAFLGSMLGLLLFAGALEIDISKLLRHKWEVFVLATVGLLISAFVIAALLYAAAGWLDLHLAFIHCLLFGALISPTDPIAVLGILRESRVPKRVEMIVSGESLFNDGVGVVVFVTIAGMAAGGQAASFSEITVSFLREALGGVLFGIFLGFCGFYALKSIDAYHVEILITLALVKGGYELARGIGVSGPLAMVVVGLFIGNHGRTFAMSEETRRNLTLFWEVVDQLLNSLLFVMIGLEVLTVTAGGSWTFVAAGLMAVPISLFARFVSIGLPLFLLPLKKALGARAIITMTWGGLRGAIAIALALSLPSQNQRDTIITITYVVVVFSIIVQGLSIKYLARR